MLSIFSSASWSSVFLLWKNVCLDLLPIFLLGYLCFLLISCMHYLYILEIKPLSVASFANIFSQSVVCLFISSSFAVQKIVSLTRSHLFLFVFISIDLGDWLKKTLVLFMSENVLPLFPSRSFMVSGLMFKSLSHFEFIFVSGVRMCSNFIDLHVAIPTFLTPLAEETIFSPLYILASFVEH